MLMHGSSRHSLSLHRDSGPSPGRDRRRPSAEHVRPLLMQKLPPTVDDIAHKREPTRQLLSSVSIGCEAIEQPSATGPLATRNCHWPQPSPAASGLASCPAFWAIGSTVFNASRPSVYQTLSTSGSSPAPRCTRTRLCAPLCARWRASFAPMRGCFRAQEGDRAG